MSVRYRYGLAYCVTIYIHLTAYLTSYCRITIAYPTTAVTWIIAAHTIMGGCALSQKCSTGQTFQPKIVHEVIKRFGIWTSIVISESSVANMFDCVLPAVITNLELFLLVWRHWMIIQSKSCCSVSDIAKDRFNFHYDCKVEIGRLNTCMSIIYHFRCTLNSRPGTHAVQPRLNLLSSMEWVS